jgi:hypothetical protein
VQDNETADNETVDDNESDTGVQDNETADNETNVTDEGAQMQEPDVEQVTIGNMTVENVTVENATAGNQTFEFGDDFDSLVITEADLPDNATVGDSYNVTVTVLNPTDERTGEFVQYKLAGSNYESERVTLAAGNTTNVTIQIENLEFIEGEWSQSVNTSSHSVFNTISVSGQQDQETQQNPQQQQGDNETNQTDTLADNDTAANETVSDNETADNESTGNTTDGNDTAALESDAAFAA